MTTLHQRLLSLLALLLVMTSLAQEPPNFARVQALEKSLAPVVASDVDGGTLIGLRPYGTNSQSLGGVQLPIKTNETTGQIIVARLDRSGKPIWMADVLVDGVDIRAQAVGRDSHSNVVLFGILSYPSSSATLRISATNLVPLNNPSGVSTSFLVKWNAQGDFAWAKRVGPLDATTSASAGLAFDSTNSIYAIGASFEGTNSTRIACKLDSAGNFLWQIPEDGSRGVGSALAVDEDDNLYVAGTFSTNITIAGVPLVNVSSSNDPFSIQPQSFVAKFSPSGNLAWVKQGGTNTYLLIRAIAVDSKTNLVVTGGSNGPHVFGIPLYRGPKTNFLNDRYPLGLVVAKLSGGGEPIWAQQVADTSAAGIALTEGTAIAIDAEDSAYAGGSMSGSLGSVAEFAGVRLPQSSASEALVVKLNSSGEPQWALQAGNPTDYTNLRDLISGITTSPDGLITVGSFTATNAVFGPLNVTTGTVATVGPYTITDICSFLALIPHPAPPLATELVGAELKVSWPTFPPEFALETATALGAPMLWTSNSVPVSTSNGTHSVTFPVDGPARYFRLRKPIP